MYDKQAGRQAGNWIESNEVGHHHIYYYTENSIYDIYIKRIDVMIHRGRKEKNIFHEKRIYWIKYEWTYYGIFILQNNTDDIEHTQCSRYFDTFKIMSYINVILHRETGSKNNIG